MNNECVCCGEIIPEGRQVCLDCESSNIRPRQIKTPCSIGDTVWAIKKYSGTEVAREGIVSEIFFTSDMDICIVVKNLCRGRWGKTVFATQEETEKAIREGRK